ncbi:MAG: hypothetical protein R3C97_14650 [Geminicoccaceae bacterium]
MGESNGGGQIVEADGTISINNENAAAAIEMVEGLNRNDRPRGSVLGYKEEDSRGVWQTGNAVFMRNWPCAIRSAMATTVPSRASSMSFRFRSAPAAATVRPRSAAGTSLSRYSDERKRPSSS